jgi:hypothetical protein
LIVVFLREDARTRIRSIEHVEDDAARGLCVVRHHRDVCPRTSSIIGLIRFFPFSFRYSENEGASLV